jgi:hypothetical protein
MIVAIEVDLKAFADCPDISPFPEGIGFDVERERRSFGHDANMRSVGLER